MKTCLALLALVAGVFCQTCTRYNAPDDFVFSTATSAYQVEGGAYTDGKGLSIWDTWTKNPILAKNSGNITCDSYHKYKEDVQMLKYLGVKRYRFSVAWSRILPYGTTKVINQKGIDYYNNLINDLIANGIEPAITMYHWDLPEALNVQGGWLNRKIVNWFGDYSRILYKNFGNRVRNWMTLNEPVVTANYGYCGRAIMSAPGNFSIMCPWTKYLAGHHLILAHATAYKIYNEEFRFLQRGSIGVVLATASYEPNSPAQEDIDATERAHQYTFGWFAGPIFAGDYPQVIKDNVAQKSQNEGFLESRLPEFTWEEKLLLRGGLFGKGRCADWLGLNNYYGMVIANRVDFPYTLYSLEEYDGSFKKVKQLMSNPEGLYKLLIRISADVKVPVMITENGLGVKAEVDSLNDQDRVEYIKQHLAVTLRARQDGANVVGYTAWSLMDNLEWSLGFTSKYGLYHVDFNDPSRPRTPKASANWYKQIVQQRYLEVCV